MSNGKLAIYLFCMLMAVGLASAQINFSTGWGKRSAASHAHPTSDGAFMGRHVADDKFLADEKVPDEPDVSAGLDRCRSLIKSLGLINLIAQTEMLGVDKYTRTGQSLASGEAEASASGRA